LSLIPAGEHLGGATFCGYVTNTLGFVVELPFVQEIYQGILLILLKTSTSVFDYESVTLLSLALTMLLINWAMVELYRRERLPLGTTAFVYLIVTNFNILKDTVQPGEAVVLAYFFGHVLLNVEKYLWPHGIY